MKCTHSQPAKWNRPYHHYKMSAQRIVILAICYINLRLKCVNIQNRVTQNYCILFGLATCLFWKEENPYNAMEAEVNQEVYRTASHFTFGKSYFSLFRKSNIGLSPGLSSWQPLLNLRHKNKFIDFISILWDRITMDDQTLGYKD